MVDQTKEVIGQAVGSKKLEAEGKADKVRGAAHQGAGDAKDAGKVAINAVKNAPSKP